MSCHSLVEGAPSIYGLKLETVINFALVSVRILLKQLDYIFSISKILLLSCHDNFSQRCTHDR